MPKMGILIARPKAGRLKMLHFPFYIIASIYAPEHRGTDQSLLGQPVRQECHNQSPRHI